MCLGLTSSPGVDVRKLRTPRICSKLGQVFRWHGETRDEVALLMDEILR